MINAYTMSLMSNQQTLQLGSGFHYSTLFAISDKPENRTSFVLEHKQNKSTISCTVEYVKWSTIFHAKTQAVETIDWKECLSSLNKRQMQDLATFWKEYMLISTLQAHN